MVFEFKKRYKIIEGKPNVFYISFTSPLYNFWRTRVIGEDWIMYKKEHIEGSYIASFNSLESAEEALQKIMEADKFVPKVVKEYT